MPVAMLDALDELSTTGGIFALATWFVTAKGLPRSPLAAAQLSFGADVGYEDVDYSD